MSKELAELVTQFFTILDRTEENDEGTRTFHPVYISSVRVMETEKLKVILARMKELAKEITDGQ